MVAMLPINVFQSHHAKPDSGVAFGVLLFAWSLLCKLDSPADNGNDILVGIAVAIAVSFKQTAIFLLAPALVGFAVLLRWECGLPWSQIVRAALVSLLACVLVWIPMNLGVLLDPLGFLDYQRATAIMMTREATAYRIAQHVIGLLAGNITRHDGRRSSGLAAVPVRPPRAEVPQSLGLDTLRLRAFLRHLRGAENRAPIPAPLRRPGVHPRLHRRFVAGRKGRACPSDRGDTSHLPSWSRREPASSTSWGRR